MPASLYANLALTFQEPLVETRRAMTAKLARTVSWLTSKAQDVAVTKLGGAPSRNSTMAQADVVRQYPEFIVFKEALKYSNPDWRPIIPVWDKINVQALGVGISEALTGKKSAEDALNGLVPQVNAIMREAGYKV